jgi:predicted dehydrogenase
MKTAHKPLKLGILGCANIARQFARDLKGCKEVALQAVASRDVAKAAAFAKEFGIGTHYGTYEALLTDASLDMIYLPLPNTLHAEWAIKAAQHGKHILCEKPLALEVSEVKRMFAAAHANRVMLLEAFPYYFQPQTGDMLGLLQSGALGKVLGVQAAIGFTAQDLANNIRFNPHLGGGAMFDAGCYPLSLIRLVMGEAPVSVSAHSMWLDVHGKNQGVDMRTAATLMFADGRCAQLSCAMDMAGNRSATIMCSQGTIETEYLNHTGQASGDKFGYLPSQMRVRHGTASNLAFEPRLSGAGSGFKFAAQAFAQVIHEQNWAALALAEQASIDIAATLEAINKSARSGKSVDV